MNVTSGNDSSQLTTVTIFQERSTLCTSCSQMKGWVRAQRLMTHEELHEYLSLDREQVSWLIKTRQLTVMRIKGEDRFDSRDVDVLVETYKKTAQRRA